MDSTAEPIRPGLLAALRQSWSEISQPGACWTGHQRIAIAAAARAAYGGHRVLGVDGLTPAAVAVIEQVSREPGLTTAAWVAEHVGALGEQPYLELVGVIARTVAADTFHLLFGVEPATLPEPHPGEPSYEPPPPQARRGRAWVSMVTASAPSVLGAVPSAEAAMNALCDELYLSAGEIGDPTFARGSLIRPQIELVATSTSLVNECFY